MKDYPTLLFDLDGTITDPGEGITKSVAYALEKYGIAVKDRRSLYPFIGPPLRDSFRRIYGFSPEQAEDAVAKYREYYRDTGIFECTVYDGMETLLADLKRAGKRLVVATSKPEEFAVRILEHFGLNRYFDCVAGATMDASRGTKSAVIAYALGREGISDPSDAVMIGDRAYDILGAKRFYMDGIGVSFGYGSREELEQAGAIAVAEDVDALRRLLLCRRERPDSISGSLGNTLGG